MSTGITYPQWGNNVCPKCGKPYGPVVGDMPVDLCDCSARMPQVAYEYPPPFRVGKIGQSANPEPSPLPLGWMCPHCRTVYAPWVTSCLCQRTTS